MKERKIHNCELMAQTWAAKVLALRTELDQQLARGGPIYPTLRAKTRQSALCLVMVREHLELLIGALNPRRDEAFTQYISALGALRELLKESDLDLSPTTPERGDSEVQFEQREQRIEAAERSVDAAPLQWCAA